MVIVSVWLDKVLQWEHKFETWAEAYAYAVKLRKTGYFTDFDIKIKKEALA